MYQGDDYDLAGFGVGIVEKSKLITTDKVKAGDILLGLASSGPHSNGYSLIRQVIDHVQADLNQDFFGITLGDALLAPTKIYVKSLLALFKTVDVHALAHITGGGLTENVPRVLPMGLNASIDLSAWPCMEVFSWLQQNGNIDPAEMLKTFNCGIGMVVCVAEQDAEIAINCLKELGETVYPIGKIDQGNEGEAARVIYPFHTAEHSE